jgi:hypothetical protein
MFLRVHMFIIKAGQGLSETIDVIRVHMFITKLSKDSLKP